MTEGCLVVSRSTAKRLYPPAQGCRFGYPGLRCISQNQPQWGCAKIATGFQAAATPLGLGILNPGLEGGTAFAVPGKPFGMTLDRFTLKN
jgi:hypothetical protein